MSKYKVTATITLTLDVMADNEKQALEIAKENFDIENHLNVLDESIKFTKAKIDDTEDDSVVFLESYDSDEDDEDEDDY